MFCVHINLWKSPDSHTTYEGETWPVHSCTQQRNHKTVFDTCAHINSFIQFGQVYLLIHGEHFKPNSNFNKQMLPEQM